MEMNPRLTDWWDEDFFIEINIRMKYNSRM